MGIMSFLRYLKINGMKFTVLQNDLRSLTDFGGLRLIIISEYLSLVCDGLPSFNMNIRPIYVKCSLKNGL